MRALLNYAWHHLVEAIHLRQRSTAPTRDGGDTNAHKTILANAKPAPAERFATFALTTIPDCGSTSRCVDDVVRNSEMPRKQSQNDRFARRPSCTHPSPAVANLRGNPRVVGRLVLPARADRRDWLLRFQPATQTSGGRQLAAVLFSAWEIASAFTFRTFPAVAPSGLKRLCPKAVIWRAQLAFTERAQVNRSWLWSRRTRFGHHRRLEHL